MFVINFKVIDLTENNIIESEKLRADVYNYKNTKPNETFFYNEMINGKVLAFGAYKEDMLIGACYVSKTFQTLFIEQLFVLQEYQNNEEHIGTNLLQYVLNNKEVCEKYFNTEFKFSYLDNKVSKEFFENLGYKENNSNMMSKGI